MSHLFNDSLKEKLINLGLDVSKAYKKGSSFLLSDGSFLNASTLNHFYVDAQIIENNLISSELNNLIQLKTSFNNHKKLHFYERILKYTDNACVLQSGDNMNWEWPYIDLPPEPLTNIQYEKLTEYIDWLHYNSQKRRFDVSLDLELLEFNLDKDSTDDIIKEIKNLYNKSYNINETWKE